MIVSFIYVILAILGLSFLIFIHELGHYWMARRVGMRVETFAIGFGKPIYSWEKDGVKWQIGWLLFGGYVKIAGTETEDGVDPYDIPDGFFGKKAWDRIKVAFMGPFVNLLFALILFAVLWISGGREKNFAEFTHKIGWIDPNSELYVAGIRPGDEITAYDDYEFQTSKDHLYAPMISSGEVEVKGYKVNYQTGQRDAFDLKVKPYSHPSFIDRNILTAGIFNPANYVLYDKLQNGDENPLPEGSPLRESGIRYGDQIVWADGELVFSSAQLSDLLNDGRVLLTIQRGDHVFLRRVSRVQAQDLRPDAEFREELIDWQHEAGLKDRKFQEIYTIPYNLTYDCNVENVLRFIDKTDQENAFPNQLFSKEDEPLQPGDKIIAAQGKPINRAFELIKEIQEKRVNIVVLRNAIPDEKLTWTEADAAYNKDVHLDNLAKIASSIGTQQPVVSNSNLVLLKPVTPKVRTDFPMSEDAKAWLETEKSEKYKAIEQIEDPEKRRYFLNLLEKNENLLVLGLPNPQDRKVTYNPKPTKLFENVFNEIWRTLHALFSGTLSPKYITGPVGIVQVVHSTSMVSFKETIFWIGAISLNLGILNLLPIPILDGGTIVFSFFEMITGRRIKPKTLEKIILVFAVLLISFFVFLTYNDILRVFGNILS
jgi:regulator of sigma E protease